MKDLGTTLRHEPATLSPLLKRLEALGYVTRTPRMLGWQAAGAAPLVLGEPVLHPETLAHTEDRYRHRTRRLRGQADGVVNSGEETISTADRRLLLELLIVERRALIRLRDRGAISDAVMRRVQREIDLEELLLGAE